MGWVVLLITLFMVKCASAPEPLSEPDPKAKVTPIPAAPAFSMKPFHLEMREEMRISFERADEIIIGLYSGSHENEQFGRFHYFDDFKSFDKDTMSWGEEMKVIVQIQADELEPEIIQENEFTRLSDLDLVGICWDPIEEGRYIYLVEGQKMLVFLQTGYDEANNRSYRNLIDAYPITPICRADELFNALIK